MFTLTIISDIAAELAFRSIRHLSEGWVFDIQYDPAEGIKSLHLDGFELDIDESKISTLESQIIYEYRYRNSPLCDYYDYIKLRRLLDKNTSADVVLSLIRNYVDFGGIFSGDLNLDELTAISNAIANETGGYVSSGLILDKGVEVLSKIASVSLWFPAPVSDFGPNALAVFRSECDLKSAVEACLKLGIHKADNWKDAAHQWKCVYGGKFFYVGS